MGGSAGGRQLGGYAAGGVRGNGGSATLQFSGGSGTTGSATVGTVSSVILVQSIGGGGGGAGTSYGLIATPRAGNTDVSANYAGTASGGVGIYTFRAGAAADVAFTFFTIP